MEPRVSLLVAMRNEAGHIEKCLASIFAQDYPQESLEVWVLDGESTDGSWTSVERLLAGRRNCHLLSNPRVTQAAGWNLGIARSTGDIVGIVSAHSELAPDYVPAAVETLRRTGADMVGGPMRAEAEGLVGQAVALATSTPFGVGGARFHYTEREEEVDTVYMGLCWRATYDWMGGFDEEMVRDQDDELSYRLRERGGRIVCNPAICSRYRNRATLRSLWRQYFQYGYWKVRVMQKHPRQMCLRQFVPAAFVVTLLFSALLAVIARGGLWALASVAGTYIAATAGVSLWLARRSGWRMACALPAVFAILHFGYGLGFLAGLLRFGLRSKCAVAQLPAAGEG